MTSFVEENREVLGRNISGLNRVSKVLVKQRDALDEILDAGPLALNNLALTYNPEAGTLDTNANIGELVNQVESDPSTFLCGIARPGRQQRARCATWSSRRCRARPRSARARERRRPATASTRRSVASWGWTR